MKKNKRIYPYLIIILLLIFFFSNFISIFIDIYNNNYEPFNGALNFTYDEISIIVNMENLTQDNHISFNKVLRQFNSTRTFYFIKTIGIPLNENLYKIVENSTVKIVQSNFPDSIFLPLVVSMYGNTAPKFVLFIEGKDIMENSENDLIKWAAYAYNKITINDYDYIFGNSQDINGKKIGCSLLFSKASIIEHLLYYTDSDTTHANPFIQLSLATKTKFDFIPFNYIKSSNLENINDRISQNMNCPSTDDKNIPSFCMMLPTFKRDYFSFSFPAFSSQTLKPKFYVVIQNHNRKHYNFSSIQKMVNEPIYHIWMQNWNPFFFLNHRLSSVFPCDFVLKYDDDQWPNDNTINQRAIESARGQNVIIGHTGYIVGKSFCGYSPPNFKKIEKGVVDHIATPYLTRPGYIKLDSRNTIYRLYGGEDIHLSLNSWKLCNVTSKTIKMKLIEKQYDGNNQRSDWQINEAYKNDKEVNYNLFFKTYCYLIHSGYIPRKWDEFQMPQKDYINITIDHKSLN